MIIFHTRSSGRQLTYEIRGDTRGRYSVRLGEKILLRGRDALSAGGRHTEPNKRKVTGALHEARRAIERLDAMTEC